MWTRNNMKLAMLSLLVVASCLALQGTPVRERASGACPADSISLIKPSPRCRVCAVHMGMVRRGGGRVVGTCFAFHRPGWRGEDRSLPSPRPLHRSPVVERFPRPCNTQVTHTVPFGCGSALTRSRTLACCASRRAAAGAAAEDGNMQLRRRSRRQAASADCKKTASVRPNAQHAAWPRACFWLHASAW